MPTIRAVTPAEPITPTSTVFVTPDSTPRTSLSPKQPIAPTYRRAVRSPPQSPQSSRSPRSSSHDPSQFQFPPPPRPSQQPQPRSTSTTSHPPPRFSMSSPPPPLPAGAAAPATHDPFASAPRPELPQFQSPPQAQPQSQPPPQPQPQTQPQQRQQHRASSSITSVPSAQVAAPANLSFNPEAVTSQPVSAGVIDILLPTSPPQVIRSYACAPDTCVIDYPPTCNRDEAITVASIMHDDNLRATLAVAGVVGDYAPHLEELLIPRVENLPRPQGQGKREVINPRIRAGAEATRFEARAAPLPKLVRRGKDVYAVEWMQGPKPFVMDFKGQNVGMDPATGEDEKDMLAMLMVTLRQAVAAGELENGSSTRSSEEKVKEKSARGAKESKSKRRSTGSKKDTETVGSGCGCVVM